MTIKKVEAMALSDLVGSLLGSIIDAQAHSARATVAFVEELGFETTEDGVQKLRTVELHYTKKDENNTPADFTVEMPLLAMTNIPSLAVKEANLSFSYDVVVASSTDETHGSSRLTKSSKGTKLLGFLRSKKPTTDSSSSTSSTSTSTIDIDITLEQQLVPVGIDRLFDLAELGITETKTET